MTSHNITIEAFRGYDNSYPQNIIKAFSGDSSRTWYARGDCECGWHSYFKWAELTYEPTTDFMLSRATASHNSTLIA